MRKKALYPVAFEAAVPRHREPKTVIALVEGVFDIPEVPSSSAPVGVRVFDADDLFDVAAGTEFRVHNERFLVDTGIPAEEFASDGVRGIDRRGSILVPALEELRKAVPFADIQHVYPPKAPQVVSGLLWNGAVPADLLETHRMMVDAAALAEPHLAEGGVAERWREITERAAASFAVIDGCVWMETLEPCYTVTANMAPGLTTRTCGFFSRLRNGYMDQNTWTYLRKEGRNFSALDRETAYRHGRRAGFDSDVEFPRIEAASADLPFIDFEAHEFERVSRLLVYDVADAFRKIAHGKGVEFFYSVPADVMEAYIAARDCLPGMDASRGISQEQEVRMQSLLDAINPAVRAGNPYVLSMDLNQVNEVFEDWLSRTVVLNSVVSMPIPGAGK